MFQPTSHNPQFVTQQVEIRDVADLFAFGVLIFDVIQLPGNLWSQSPDSFLRLRLCDTQATVRAYCAGKVRAHVNHSNPLASRLMLLCLCGEDTRATAKSCLLLFAQHKHDF